MPMFRELAELDAGLTDEQREVVTRYLRGALRRCAPSPDPHRPALDDAVRRLGSAGGEPLLPVVGDGPGGAGTGWSSGWLVGAASSGPSYAWSSRKSQKPVLAGLVALHERVPGQAVVGAGVLPERGVAAADVAAGGAAAQVEPPAARRGALDAAGAARRDGGVEDGVVGHHPTVASASLRHRCREAADVSGGAAGAGAAGGGRRAPFRRRRRGRRPRAGRVARPQRRLDARVECVVGPPGSGRRCRSSRPRRCRRAPTAAAARRRANGRSRRPRRR